MAEGVRLLAQALAPAGDTFATDDVCLVYVNAGRLYFGDDGYQPAGAVWRSIVDALQGGAPVVAARDDGGDVVVHPLRHGDEVLGLVTADRGLRPFATPKRRMLALVADRLAVSLENARLYRQLDTLFRQYIPAEVATALVENPDQAALGGEVREVTVLFADLRGYTGYAERVPPQDVLALLNRYFEAAVPLIVAEGGTVATFIGDALMALFNAPGAQSDHPLHAEGAAGGQGPRRARHDLSPDRPARAEGTHRHDHASRCVRTEGHPSRARRRRRG